MHRAGHATLGGRASADSVARPVQSTRHPQALEHTERLCRSGAEQRLRVRFSACQLDAWVAERLRSGVERVSSPVGSAVFWLTGHFVRPISLAPNVAVA